LPFWNRKTDVWLIVGLGNPGEKYARNRHNIGFMCLDYFARARSMSFGRNRAGAKVAEGKIAGKDTVLAKPQTFVNLSGQAVGKLLQKHGVKPERLIVVHDDMDLPTGKMRLRQGGTSGHNGIKSIVEHTGTEDFIRVRVGVGRPESEENGRAVRHEVVSHVLGDFSAEEQAVIEKVIPAVSEALLILLTEGVTAAMNRYNGLDFAGPAGK
jgi:PTH1 family peptidyl-tRNA hydrolase